MVTLRSMACRLGLVPPGETESHAARVARRARMDESHMRVLYATALAPDAHCIDVGAHDGRMLQEFVRCAPLGQHIAFEPLPHLAERLARTYPSVIVHALALAETSGETSFRYVRSAPEYSGLRERDYGGPQDSELLTVRTARLDDLVPPDYVPTLIKIDVEGGELGVLRGGLKTLERARPLIVFEHGAGGREAYGTTPEDIWRLLTDLGMRLYDLDGHGPYRLDQFCEESTLRRWNWLARP